VITPVSLGNSSALTHVSRSLLRELPVERRKLLVFTDSRQDAAHQARFMRGSEQLLQLRRFIYDALSTSTNPHDLRWLEQQVYERYAAAGEYKLIRCSHDERERRRRRIDGDLLHEFIIAPNVRASLERLGLVELRYSALDDELQGEEFGRLIRDRNLDFDRAGLAVKRLLDFFRNRRAVDHEAMRRWMRGTDPVAREYNITPGREVGIPVAYLEPGKSSDLKATYKLFSSWNRVGMPAGPQSIWRQTLDVASEASFDAVLEWMVDEGRFLVRARIGKEARETEGIVLRHDAIEACRASSYARCPICGRIEGNGRPGLGCARPRCSGTMRAWEGPIEDGNLNAKLIAASASPALWPGEHSAAVTEDERLEAEAGSRQFRRARMCWCVHPPLSWA
jgi:hypothetical protein